MCHDDAANEARAGAPAGLLRVHQLTCLIQELSAKGSRKVVAQVMTRAGLPYRSNGHHLPAVNNTLLKVETVSILQNSQVSAARRPSVPGALFCPPS